MKPLTIQRFQLISALFGPSVSYPYQGSWSVGELAQYRHTLHVWATDNLYRLPEREGATVIIQSNSN